MSLIDTAKKPVNKDWHPADIKAALEKRGWSLAELSLRHSYSRTLAAKALHYPYPNMERIIGKALGVHPKSIWPSRYDENGRPNRPMGRPRGNDSTTPDAGNVEMKAAA